MVTFEKATPADATALTAVQTRTFDDDSRRFTAQLSGGPPGYDEIDWQLQMMGLGHYYKIVADERLIGGLIVFDQGGGHYELGRIYIDPAYQNQGLGGQAMQFIEQTFPQARQWTLDTPSWAVRNQHFYEKWGYAKVQEEAIAPGFTLFFYEKHLGGQS
jgi:GNAT superfamily N-acetyltransferase